MQEYLVRLLEILYDYFFDPRYIFYWFVCILIFVGVYSFFKNKKNTVSISIAFIVAYYFMVYSYTVLSRQTAGYSIQVIPFWSYITMVQTHSKMQVLWISINLAMLFPIGFLLPFSFKNLKWYQVILIALILSYTIEFSQLLLHKGTFELFDDPINNVIGCLIGYVFGKIFVKKR